MKNIRTAVGFVVTIAGAGCDRTPPPAQSVATTAPSTAVAPPVVSAASAPMVSASSAPSAAPVLPATLQLNFDADTVGGPAAGIEAVIGDWVVAEQDGARGFLVDGSRWRNGTPSVNLADQARKLYGDRYAEFLDGVRAFAFFPLAVVQQDPPKGDIRLSVRFYPINGQVDQAAGITFDIQPDGSYYGVRANALEDNILYFHVVRGKRTVIDTIRNTPTPTHTWHTLVVSLRGLEMSVELDGKQQFKKTLAAMPSGRVGLWSKADSRVLFDDFKVEPLH